MYGPKTNLNIETVLYMCIGKNLILRKMTNNDEQALRRIIHHNYKHVAASDDKLK